MILGAHIRVVPSYAKLRWNHFFCDLFLLPTPPVLRQSFEYTPTLSAKTLKMVKDNPKTQPQAKSAKKGRSAISDVVAREYTIHLHKRVCHSFLT